MPDPALHLHVTPAVVREFLTGAGEFLEPSRLLGDLTGEQATTVPPGSLYSIAEIVAHMHYWQERNIHRARGTTSPRPEHLDDTFPAPAAAEWDALRAAFLNGLSECAQAAADQALEPSSKQNESTVAYDLAACPALHSAYHYGQISILRQLQGLWPPVGGDDGW